MYLKDVDAIELDIKVVWLEFVEKGTRLSLLFLGGRLDRVVDGMVLCFVVDSWDLKVGKGEVGGELGRWR